MSEELFSILGEDGQLESGSQVPELSDEQLLELYRNMVFNRLLDDRLTRLQRQGRIGFFIGSTGEEAAIIGSAFALQREDWLIPCYREAGAAFTRGYSLRDFLSQVFGTSEDKMKGRQMPCHWGSRDLNLVTVSSPVGTQIPHAVGVAMAASIRKTRQVALVYFGEGATSEGDFHVACNFAGVFSAPVVFLCRNNQWAISVPLERQTASETIAIKAKAYGIGSMRVDGNDVLAVYQATREAAARARRGEGATLIEAVTYRQGAHSTSDDPRAYREDREVEQWLARDPISRYCKFLIERKLWSEADDTTLEAEIKAEIQVEVERAEAAEPPALTTMVEDVLETVPWHLKEQLREVEEASE